ncbi:calcium/proton exchanger [Tanacetum coccineum]|uniref:Calcium/proton exchanger n=1 Tax=Tanacetum coccineum TaxID=301880 RepID=A0ABQ5B3Z8_9ASTR
MQANEAEKKNEAGKEEMNEVPSSQPVEYYLKHSINKKLIEGLVDNRRKKITGKEDIGGNFKIPCNIGGLKHVNALVDQGSDINVMPLSTYTKLTNERLAETDIRLSLASHSYIYPLGSAEDILVEERVTKNGKDDKTGLGMEKTVKDKAKSKPKSQSSQKVNRKVNGSKSKSTQVNPEAKSQRNISLGTETVNP